MPRFQHRDRTGGRRTGRWFPGRCGLAGAGVMALVTAGVVAIPPAAASSRPSPGLTSHGRLQTGPGTAMAWGDNTAGELGDDSLAQSDVPVPVHGLTGVVSAAAGGRQDLALLANGTVLAWGDDTFGELGNGIASSDGDSEHPIAVPGLTGVTAVAAGEADSLALLTNGTVMAWGDNRSGQLGDGSTKSSPVPVAVQGLTGVTAIAAGGEFNLALLANGTVMSWGTNGNDQLGDGKGGLHQFRSDVPVPVQGLTGVISITAGGQVGAAVLANGTVMAWPAFNRPVPAAVPLVAGAKQIAAGFGSFVTLMPDGTVVTWAPTATGFTTPVKVAGLAKVTAIATSSEGCCTSFLGFSLALTAGGTVKAWGDDVFGELGDGSTTDSSVPVVVKSLSGATAIAAGDVQAIALTAGTSPPASPHHGPFSSIWRQTANPENLAEPGGIKDTFLDSVSAASGTDAWAVGFHSLASSQPLAEHFNGRTWAIAPTPLPDGATAGQLNGVDEISPGDVWAVGSSSGTISGNALTTTLAEHFDGSTWTIVPTPDPATNANSVDELDAVGGTGPDDLWAAGSVFNFTLQTTTLLFEHFNGTRWHVVAAPSTTATGGFPALDAVTAISPSDVWAVGQTQTEAGKGGIDNTLTVHWNGSSWQVVPSPCLSGDGTVIVAPQQCTINQQNHLTGATALAAGNVWASGYLDGSDGRIPYVLHWDGTAWSLTKTPTLGGTELFGITALSAHDIWVAGSDFSVTGVGLSVVEQFNGTSWSLEPILHPGQDSGVPNDTLSAIASAQPGTLFTIGAQHVPDQGFCCEFGLAERSTRG
jgi:alpha-tubulin suppressor-like RCC1 family protein